MKKILIFFVIFSAFYNAQSHRFIYEYTFRNDSLRKDSVKAKLMRLNVTKDFSEFLSEKKAKDDSIILKNLGSNREFDIVFSSNELSTDSHYNYETGELLAFAEVGIQDFKVKISALPMWKLGSETKQIKGYLCQKATSNYGGRNWTAWFTQEVPLHEGPYIFKGLPGLIIEIEDSTKSHHFVIAGNHKSTNAKSLRFTMGEIITLDAPKFTKERECAPGGG